MKTGIIVAGAALLPLGQIAFLHAQSDDEIMGELEEFYVRDITIEESILPTTRPFNSVYGTDRSVLDTPRNVTIISREQLDAIAIKDVRDFSKLTSSSYTKTNFGAPTTPNLRGQEADVFINGIRRGLSSNGNGLPINFNSVESVNIVKGPAGAVYGTTNYLGGYVDLISKRPRFDRPTGEVAFSIASYDQYTWNLDYSTPIGENSAFRVSYEGKEWDGFWEVWKQNSHALYMSYVARPSENYTIEVMGEYFVADYAENWGVNRVTQDLFDKGEYIPNAQTDSEYDSYISLLGNQLGFFIGAEPGSGFASLFGSAGFKTMVQPDINNPVPVDRAWKLAAPGDDSYGKHFWFQVDQVFTPNDGLKIVNKSAFRWTDRDTFSSYNYNEVLDDVWAVDNRTEFQFSTPSEGLNIDWNTGFRFRYQYVLSGNSFANEPVNFWDLSRGLDNNNRRVPDQGFLLDSAHFIWPGREARGIHSNYYIGGFSEFTDVDGDGLTEIDGTAQVTKTYIVGPYIQTDIQFSEKFSLLAGITYDYIDGEEYFPEFLVNTTGTGEDFYQGETLQDDDWLVNYNISPVFKPSENTTLYATWNFSETTTNETGGAVPADFSSARESELLEFGAKFSFMENTLFIGAAYVDREFTVTNQDSSVDTVLVEAFEIEFNYQPNASFFMTFGYSHLSSERTISFAASPYTIDRADETPAITNTGEEIPLYVTPTFSTGEASGFYHNPGTPENLINFLVQKKFDLNADTQLGLMANFVGWGETQSGYDGFTTFVDGFEQADDGSWGWIPDKYELTANTATLDFQYELDLTAFVEMQNWEFKVTVFNVTDEENWDVNNSGYGNGSAVTRMPTRYEFTAKYKW